MLVIRPFIFNKFSEIVCAFSTKVGLNRKAPYYFNMSYNVGDDSKIVEENRRHFLAEIGLEANEVSWQKQVHEDKVTITEQPGNCGESDALITQRKNLGLIISSADCPAIFISDNKRKVIAAVHSGWRSTEKNILKKTLTRLRDEFKLHVEDLTCYIGPSISQVNYEVGEEVADRFDAGFVKRKNGKCFLDLRGINLQTLLEAGVHKNNIQVSKLCTYEYNSLLHSYRRDGSTAGRAIGIIAMKGKS